METRRSRSRSGGGGMDRQYEVLRMRDVSTNAYEFNPLNGSSHAMPYLLG